MPETSDQVVRAARDRLRETSRGNQLTTIPVTALMRMNADASELTLCVLTGCSTFYDGLP